MKFFALVAAVSATQYDNMSEDELLVNLESTLSSALSSEARGDGDAAVAKTAAIKNIQKALTARILKRLDDGQPLVEVARKMKAIEGMQPQINDLDLKARYHAVRRAPHKWYDILEIFVDMDSYKSLWIRFSAIRGAEAAHDAETGTRE